VTALATTLLARAAGAAEFQDRPFNIVPFGGWTFFDSEYKSASGPEIKDDVYYGGRLSARLISPLWLDLAGGLTHTTMCAICNQDVNWSHYSANLMLISSAPHHINPYISLGGGVSIFEPKVSADKHDGLFEAAGGLRVRITDAIGLRLEARNLLFMPKKNYTKAHFDNIVVGAGLVFAFGGKTRDADGDGVPDKRDKCPDTPHGCTVDVNGCPADADGDGVCDGNDKCPGTPNGARVDAKGCPTDSDGDGIYDGLDRCPDTAKGCKVDAQGCPIDSDGDGVCDGLDECANTTSGCKVDAKGCTTDGDGDGVCDGLDKCPDTPMGQKVNSDGCPPTEVEQRETEMIDTGLIRLKDVKFETAKANILPESYPALDVVGQVLSKWSQLNIQIDGHCDSRGSDAYNLSLSHRRANSVRAYLLEHFPTLQAGQLTTRGYGESKPLLPNTSPENMAENRRVEFTVLNKELLKRPKP
jgi:outer membrane protein OmpA-like peptidoglycan-associated protein